MLYKQHLIKGALFILISEFLFASMGAIVKNPSSELSNEMLVFIRNLFGLLMLSSWLLRHGIDQLKTQNLHLHLLRSILGVSALYCFFYALGNMVLAEGLLLKMTSPFFTVHRGTVAKRIPAHLHIAGFAPGFCRCGVYPQAR